MKVPCPVPLQSPWSPVGYQVVKVADDTVPMAQPCPSTGQPGGGGPVPEPARAPSSPMGYRVTQVGEEHVPVVVRRPVQRLRSLERPPARGTPLLAIWGPITAVSLILVAFVFASISASVRSQAAWAEGDFAQPPMQIQIPEAPQVILPEAAAADPRGPEQLPAPAEANVPLPKKEGCPDGNACKPAKAADRETFGTAVAFVRNPIEATRLAGEERKLAFVLHVSGNFEEARFT